MSQLAQAHLAGTVEAGAQGGQDTQHPGLLFALYSVKVRPVAGPGKKTWWRHSPSYAQVSHHGYLGSPAGTVKRETEGWVRRGYADPQTAPCSKYYCCCRFSDLGKKGSERSLHWLKVTEKVHG